MYLLPPTDSTSSPAAPIGNALARIGYVVLCAFVVLLPWGEDFLVLNGLVLASWIGILLFGIAAMRTVVARQTRKLSLLHYWMLAFVGWIVLSILWTTDRDVTVTRIGTYFQLVAMVWLVWELVPSQRLVQGLLGSYVVGSLIASVMTLYNFLNGRTAAQLAAAEGIERWETSRYSVFGVNENDLGVILALSMPMIFYLLVSGKSPLIKLVCWLQLVAGMTAIFLTASRGALAAAIIGLAMFPLTLSRLPRWQRLLSLAACAGLIACAAYLVPPSSWVRIAEFKSEVLGGGLTHRTLLWAAGLSVFRDHPFLGVGAGAYGLGILRMVDIPLVAHNTFLSVLVELGVGGALLLAGLLACLLYCAARMRYLERCLWITLLLTWAIGVSALTWEYRKPTWMLFGLLAAHAYSRRTEARQVERRIGDVQTVPKTPCPPTQEEVETVSLEECV
jgi:O-antigen ligase